MVANVMSHHSKQRIFHKHLKHAINMNYNQGSEFCTSTAKAYFLSDKIPAILGSFRLYWENYRIPAGKWVSGQNKET